MGINNSNNANMQFDFLDIISIINFFIGLRNFNETIEQGSTQDIINSKTHDIHEHLTSQDKKIDEILKRLEVIENDYKGNLREDNGTSN